mgnify:CR=1 FL=1
MSRQLFCPACEREVPLQGGTHRRGLSLRYATHPGRTPGKPCALSRCTEGDFVDRAVLAEALAYVERLAAASKANVPVDEIANAKLKRAYAIRKKFRASRARLFKEA